MQAWNTANKRRNIMSHTGLLLHSKSPGGLRRRKEKNKTKHNTTKGMTSWYKKYSLSCKQVKHNMKCKTSLQKARCGQTPRFTAVLQQTPAFCPYDTWFKKWPIACSCLILLSGFDLLVEFNQRSLHVKTEDHWFLAEFNGSWLKKSALTTTRHIIADRLKSAVSWVGM